MFDFECIFHKLATRKLLVGETPYLTIGDGSYVVGGHFETYSDNCCHILIGKYCSIAHDINFLLSMNHDYRTVTNFPWNTKTFFDIANVSPKISIPTRVVNRRQIIIGNDVWIGRGATIMSGVRIGNGAVIGAESVVTKNVPPYAIVVGNPARIIKYRFDPETIRKLQAIRWWNWSPEKIVEEFSISDDPQDIVKKFYSPDLEVVPKDSLGDHIRNFKSRGFKIFSTIADFQAKSPAFEKIVKDFLSSQLIQNSILVIHLRQDISQDQMIEIRNMIEKSSEDKLILAIKSHDSKPFSLDSLRETDIFVTTREDDCSIAIDAMSDLDFQTRYIFDDLVFY